MRSSKEEIINLQLGKREQAIFHSYMLKKYYDTEKERYKTEKRGSKIQIYQIPTTDIEVGQNIRAIKTKKTLIICNKCNKIKERKAKKYKTLKEKSQEIKRI